MQENERAVFYEWMAVKDLIIDKEYYYILVNGQLYFSPRINQN
jgi:hypothetical protein